MISRFRFVRRASAALAACVVAAPIAAAQQRPDTAAHQSVLTRSDAITLAAFAVGTVALMPLDRHIAQESQRSALQTNGGLSHTASVFRVLGAEGAIGLAGATYLFGRADDSPKAAELGLRTLESIGVAGATTFVIKGMVGRARPFVVADTNSREFRAGRGFSNDKYTSFPSGHTTVAFAAASAASQEIHYLWPNASPLWSPALYTAASLVGLSRVYNDQHWASDVVAGAAVGTLAGRAVVRFQRAHPGNAIDRWLLPTSVTPEKGGVALAWSERW
ncbi:MAG TPA: phosphatase PAP2 family protein [Candidatus Elarobacter sp.]|nr:phosphatase PAP2 family protein [Candidatus Elarobacter sp.]